MPGDMLIVAGHYFQSNAQIGESRQRPTGPRLRWIEKGQESREGQARLVSDARLLVVRFDLPPRHPQNSVALSAEAR